MAMRIIYKIKISNIPIIIALALLVSAPVLITQKQVMLANEVAKYAYYLLIIGITWKLVLYLLTKKQLSDVS